MSELSSRGITLNGRELNGRTYPHEDGSYETLDLSDVSEGDFITVITGTGTKYELLKTTPYPVLEGWKLQNDVSDKYGGRALTLILLEPNPNGQSTWHHGIVASESLELGIKDNDKNLNIINNLGKIAAILPSYFDGQTVVNASDQMFLKAWYNRAVQLISRAR